jgi:streptogramin lyase
MHNAARVKKILMTRAVLTAAVRQLNGRAGEVWGAESATDRLVVIRATGK